MAFPVLIDPERKTDPFDNDEPDPRFFDDRLHFSKTRKEKIHFVAFRNRLKFPEPDFVMAAAV